MKKLFRLSCIMLAGIVSCSLSGNAQARDYFLTLTVIPDSNLQVSFYLEANPGQIEWGDGSIERLATTHTVKGVHSHTYTSDTEQTIEIHSDSIALFKIRVGLRTLNCGAARLTSLDVEGCTRLWYVNCATNRLSASALNSMFESLPDPFTGFAKGVTAIPGNHDALSGENYESDYRAVEPMTARLSISGNRGERSCKKEIVEMKHWEFE